MEDKSLVWLQSGGAGNIIMRTALLPELREKYGDEIYIIDPYADIWEVNDVNSYPQAPNSLYSQLIKDNDDCDVVAENPYNNSDFIKKGDIHFLDAVRDTLGFPRKGVEECMKENPILPVAEKHPEVLEDVKKYLEELGFESTPEITSNRLYYMKQNGVFDKIKGLWIGNYEHVSGFALEKIVMDVLGDEYKFPIIKSNNFGHIETKTVIPIGVKARIDTNKDVKIELLESCVI